VLFFSGFVYIQLQAAKDCHCERSEAISALKGRDCFVVSLLAMTENGQLPSVTEGLPGFRLPFHNGISLAGMTR